MGFWEEKVICDSCDYSLTPRVWNARANPIPKKKESQYGSMGYCGITNEDLAKTEKEAKEYIEAPRARFIRECNSE